MQFDLLFRAAPAPDPESAIFVRNDRARRYVLRLTRDGKIRVTIPARGTLKFAKEFLQRNLAWVEKQREKRKAQAAEPKGWHAGDEIFFRGMPTKLESFDDALQLGSERIKIPSDGPPTTDFRSLVERHLLLLAGGEFPPRVLELAAQHKLTVRRIAVRDQRTRWGSCSRHATISLNWRLIQAPPFVLDYLILHELAHLKHMNHSRRYWQEVARMCPGYEAAERWLKTNGRLLRSL